MVNSTLTQGHSAFQEYWFLTRLQDYLPLQISCIHLSLLTACTDQRRSNPILGLSIFLALYKDSEIERQKGKMQLACLRQAYYMLLPQVFKYKTGEGDAMAIFEIWTEKRIWTITPALLLQFHSDTWTEWVCCDNSHWGHLCWLLTSEDSEFKKSESGQDRVCGHPDNVNLSSTIFPCLCFLCLLLQIHSLLFCVLGSWPLGLPFWCFYPLESWFGFALWEALVEEEREDEQSRGVYYSLSSLPDHSFAEAVFL